MDEFGSLRDRIYNPSKYDKIGVPVDGGNATIYMANADNYAFPQVFYNPQTKKLELEKDWRVAMDRAKKEGTLFEFESPELASWFAENGYKMNTPLQSETDPSQMPQYVPKNFANPILPPTSKTKNMLTPGEIELKGLMSLPSLNKSQRDRLNKLMFLMPSLAQKTGAVEQNTEAPVARIGAPVVAPTLTDALAKRTNVTDPYAKFFTGANDYTTKALQRDINAGKEFKSGVLGNIVATAPYAIMGLGQMLGGRKVLRNLGEPKYPEQLPNQQLASRLAQAQADAQMADPLIREQALTDMAAQKRMDDEIARVTAGGDIAAYAGQAQANQGRQYKFLRDLAMAQNANKMQRQGILDNLIGQKIGEENKLFGNKLRKFETVDMPEYQARRGYGQNLVNQGLANVLAPISKAGEFAQLFSQNKNIQAGMVEKFKALPYEEQLKVAEKYPAFKQFIGRKPPVKGGEALVVKKTPKSMTEELVELSPSANTTAFNWQSF